MLTGGKGEAVAEDGEQPLGRVHGGVYVEAAEAGQAKDIDRVVSETTSIKVRRAINLYTFRRWSLSLTMEPVSYLSRWAASLGSCSYSTHLSK